MRDYKANTFQMDSSIFQFGLTPIQFVVYSYLKYCAGNRCACRIKLQTIASVCECSRSSVKRALNVLRDRGFIDIKGGAQKLRGKGHRQTCNRYYCLDSSEWKPPIEKWPMRGKSCSPHNHAHKHIAVPPAFCVLRERPPAKTQKRPSSPFYTLATQSFRNVRNAPRVVIPPHPKHHMFRRVRPCVRFFSERRVCTHFRS